MTNTRFALADGRHIGLSTFGNPWSQRLVIFFPPSPGSSDFDPDPPSTSVSGARVLSFDRPGYGGSDPVVPGRRPTIRGFADDVAQRLISMHYLADSPARRAELDPVGVVGWGYGAVVALSFSARHPELVDSVVVVDARSPRKLRNETAALTLDVPRARYAQSLDELAAGLASDPRTATQWLGIPDDEPLLGRPGLRNRLERMVRDSPQGGMAGLASDITAAGDTRWGRELPSISAPVTLIYSDQSARRRIDALLLKRRIAKATTLHARGSGSLAAVELWPRLLDHPSASPRAHAVVQRA